jgi:hypothetical protein
MYIEANVIGNRANFRRRDYELKRGGVRVYLSSQVENLIAYSLCVGVLYRFKIYIEQLQSLFVDPESRQKISIVPLFFR